MLDSFSFKPNTFYRPGKTLLFCLASREGKRKKNYGVNGGGGETDDQEEVDVLVAFEFFFLFHFF